jgi:1-acyl-sn-glycerol-3-phosphate acyltransferase
MFFGLIYSFFVNLFDPTGDRFNKIAAWWGRLCSKLFKISIEVIGEENYQPEKNYLIISNHASIADIPILLSSINLNLRIIAKEEVGKIPLFGPVIKQAGFIMIKRGQNREALQSLLKAADVLKSGRSVHIFPEGTRSETGKLLPFKRGAFLIAQKSDAEILPIAIIGSNFITPKNSLKINKGNVVLVIGKPINPSSSKNIEKIVETCHNTIQDSLLKYS